MRRKSSEVAAKAKLDGALLPRVRAGGEGAAARKFAETDETKHAPPVRREKSLADELRAPIRTARTRVFQRAGDHHASHIIWATTEARINRQVEEVVGRIVFARTWRYITGGDQ